MDRVHSVEAMYHCTILEVLTHFTSQIPGLGWNFQLAGHLYTQQDAP